jgi:hypothetical protein
VDAQPITTHQRLRHPPRNRREQPVYATVGSVSGGSTSTFNDPTISVAASYYYEIQATHALWRSAASTPAHVVTVLGLCN